MPKLGNVEVVRVLEETDKATWFVGPEGVLYRYLKAWRTAWPVVVKEEKTETKIPFESWD